MSTQTHSWSHSFCFLFFPFLKLLPFTQSQLAFFSPPLVSLNYVELLSLSRNLVLFCQLNCLSRLWPKLSSSPKVLCHTSVSITITYETLTIILTIYYLALRGRPLKASKSVSWTSEKQTFISGNFWDSFELIKFIWQYDYLSKVFCRDNFTHPLGLYYARRRHSILQSFLILALRSSFSSLLT